MSTTYRVVVHCDAQRSDRCAGFLEDTVADALADAGEQLDRLFGRLADAGWQRSYTAAQSIDACPACWAAAKDAIEEAMVKDQLGEATG